MTSKQVDSFWQRVDKTGDCWVWTAHLTTKGYGKYSYYTPTRIITKRAHRLSYELEVSEIAPDGELDHLCRNRACVKPEHLELVSHQENCARGIGSKKYCVHNHPCGLKYLTQNATQRKCRTCIREYNTACRLRKRKLQLC